MQSKTSLIRVMSGIVVLMAGLVALSLIAANPNETPVSMAAVTRAPAGLVPKTLTERTAVLNLPCRWRPEMKVDQEVKHVRVRGKICGHDEPLQASEIVNTSNGYRATVFHPAAHSYTSDYIHLSEGRNKLVFYHVLSTGEKISREMTVTRSN